MTYAIFGYEATPSKPEVSLYLGTLGFIAVLSVVAYLINTKPIEESK
jgi:hypothetical protein